MNHISLTCTITGRREIHAVECGATHLAAVIRKLGRTLDAIYYAEWSWKKARNLRRHRAILRERSAELYRNMMGGW
jgi:membrane-anchored protein YejM (alkaline phosphatase superfamily)